MSRPPLLRSLDSAAIAEDTRGFTDTVLNAVSTTAIKAR
jgi:hypothetical protein